MSQYKSTLKHHVNMSQYVYHIMKTLQRFTAAPWCSLLYSSVQLFENWNTEHKIDFDPMWMTKFHVRCLRSWKYRTIGFPFWLVSWVPYWINMGRIISAANTGCLVTQRHSILQHAYSRMDQSLDIGHDNTHLGMVISHFAKNGYARSFWEQRQ